MRSDFLPSPRTFECKGRTISDQGKLHLAPGEMFSLVTDDGRECDITATDWGYYLGPSLNDRLRRQGFKAALVVNEQGQLYVNAVHADRIDEFKRYLTTGQRSRIVCWLDEWLTGE